MRASKGLTGSVVIINVTRAIFNCFAETEASVWRKDLKIRRRTEITIQTERVQALIGSKPESYAVCAACARNVLMLTAEDAANNCRFSLRVIFRFIENGQIHFQETPDGSLLVCLASLAAIENQKLLGEQK